MQKYLLILTVMLPLLVQAADLQQKALDIAHRYPLVDGHVDVPYRLQEAWEDVTQATAKGNFDFPRAQAGGLDAPFMSIYIPAAKEGFGALALANILIDQVEAIVFRAPEKFAIARTAAQIRTNHINGIVSLPMGLENGAAVEGDLKNLSHLYNRGIRYITLAHSRSNHIADSSYDHVKIWNGLSPFGVKVIAEMNRLGIMVDVSHVSDAAFYQAVKLSKTPVIASHSSLRHFTPGLERNVDDKMLKALADKDGVIMINFGSFFLSEKAVIWYEGEREALAAYKGLQGKNLTDAATEHFRQQYKTRFPYPYATVSDVVDHIDRTVKLVGIDHVGLGSDFDGVDDTLPEGLKDVADYPNLIEALLKRRYKEADIAKIMGGNILRVMEKVEQYADNPSAKFEEK